MGQVTKYCIRFLWLEMTSSWIQVWAFAAKRDKRFRSGLRPEEAQRYAEYEAAGLDPFVELDANLYGHPLASFVFEAFFGSVFMECDFQLAVPGASTALWKKIVKTEVGKEKPKALGLRFADDFLLGSPEHHMRILESDVKKKVKLKGDRLHEVGLFIGCKHGFSEVHNVSTKTPWKALQG